MPITASFAADFSDFSTEVQKAQRELESFEGQTEQTGSALTTLGTTSTSTAGPVNTLHQSFRQFDGALSAVGIHIGPAVQGLSEIQQASGKTASELGALATAGLAVGAALAGWKIGRAIAEFFGLDQAIANSTAKLLGWGDLAAQTAGAKADVLARATRNAHREITDFGEALRINQKAYDDHVKSVNADAAAVAQGAKDRAAALALQTKAEQDAADETAKTNARITADAKAHADQVLAIRDRVLGKDAIAQAQLWVEAFHLLGNNIDVLTREQLAELQTTMQTAIEAMTRSGTLTDLWSQSFTQLALQAGAALAALGPVVSVTQDYTREAQAAAQANDEWIASLVKASADADRLAAAARDAKMARTQSASFIGGGMPTSDSLALAALRPGSMLGLGGGGRNLNLEPSGGLGPWAPQQAVVNNFTMNYPILNDPTALDQLGRVVGDAIMSRTTRTGR